MMRTILLILLSCYLTKADYDARCSDGSKTGLTFEPSTDGVGGRYKLDWCTSADQNITTWELVMRYVDQRKEKCAGKYDFGPPGTLHSRFDQAIALNLTCANVCFSTYLDLIFNGTCYHIKTWLQSGTTSYGSYDALHYIINPYNREYFTENQAFFSFKSIDDVIELHLHTGYVPINSYTMEMQNENLTWGEDVTDRCEALGAEHVRCRVRAPHDCYGVLFRHLAPWTAALSLFNSTLAYGFCHCAEQAPGAGGGGGARWWAAGGAAAALAALAAALLWRERRARQLRKRVLWDWLARREPAFAAEGKAAGAEPEPGAVLLLYARDCAPLMRVAAALRALVQHAGGCQVIDLYDGATVSAMAPGPAPWVRALLRREDVRVLLLQTPAAAALHEAALEPPRASASLAPSLPRLSAPLMGSRAAYRRPHAGDAAFALALRLLAESAHAHPTPYRKYFVAEVAGMPADLLRDLTPLRRYALPLAARALVRDLSGDSSNDRSDDPSGDWEERGARLERELAEAAEALRALAKERPDFLADELVFL